MPTKTRRRVRKRSTRKRGNNNNKLTTICPCSPDVGDCPQCKMPK